MQTSNQQHGSSHTNMLHAGHCRGRIASAQTLTTPPRSGQLDYTKPGQRHSRVSSLRPRREAGAGEQAVSSRMCCAVCASAAVRALAEESPPCGAPKPDNIDRKRRLLARPQTWGGGGGRGHPREVPERSRSLKPHASILSNTRVGG